MAWDPTWSFARANGLANWASLDAFLMMVSQSISQCQLVS